jgi:SNF2 family DNA or RNA helicase
MKPYPYQQDGIDWLVKTRRALLCDEMGLGKSMQAILACKELDAQSVLVVCLNTMKWAWASELQKWWPEATYQVVHGTYAKRDQAWRRDARVYIVNFEAFVRDAAELVVDWDVVIFDEAFPLQNRKTKTFKTAQTFARRAKNVFILTGTPIVTNPDNLWSLLHLIDPQEHGSYWRFVRTYCDVYWAGFAYTIGDLLCPDDLAAHLVPYALRRTKSEVLRELPEKTVQQVWCELSDISRRKYDEMDKEFYVNLGGGQRALALNVISRIRYLQQIAIDPSLLDDAERGPLLCPKTQVVLDTARVLAPKSLIVFSTFKKAITRTIRMLQHEGFTAGAITGDTPPEERVKLVQAFQAGDIQILGLTLGVGGAGLTLTAASTAVFLDKHWTPARNQQAQDRLHRIGQAAPVHIIEALSQDTIDEVIEKILHSREVVNQKVLSQVTLTDLYIRAISGE